MLTIRRYTPADQAAVEYLHVFVIQQAEAHLGRGPLDDEMYAIEEHYLNTNGEFLIGEIEDQIVAMDAFRRTSSIHAEIMRIRVHPHYQGQGLGQQAYSTNLKLAPVQEATPPSISTPQRCSLPRRSCMSSMAITRLGERCISSSRIFCMRKCWDRGRFISPRKVL